MGRMLKPCPCCRSTDLQAMDGGPIRCRSCGATCPDATAWDARTPPPATAEMLAEFRGREAMTRGDWDDPNDPRRMAVPEEFVFSRQLFLAFIAEWTPPTPGTRGADNDRA